MQEVHQPIPKLEGKGLVMGRPAYTNDLAPQNALVLKVLRSPHAFARITKIDAQKAAAVPGVVCILTYKDLPRTVHTRAGQGYPEPSPYDKFVLDEYVRYCGDEAAVVAAVSEQAASTARDLIEIDYEILPPVLDFETAQGNPSVIHFEPEVSSNFEIGLNARQNIAAAYEMEVGNTAGVLACCEVVVKERFYTQAQAHVMMEPHVSAAYIDMHGRLTVISSTQTPFHVRRIISKVLDVPTRNIRVIKPRIGGGFGGKIGRASCRERV